MNISDIRIDSGKSFDWGRVSAEYARFRDIYPDEFYDRIIQRSLCVKGQRVLDVGTGTGVLPRNMYKYGAEWTAVDLSENQIEQAKLMSDGMDIKYKTSAAENLDFPEASFDVITACQCFWYFEHEKTSQLFYKLLKPGGRLVLLCMEWLPYEDKVAGESEKLVLKYNPVWSGAGSTMHQIEVPEEYKKYFDVTYHDEYKLNVRFTREGWNGRMKSCRGIGASLEDSKISEWEKEHMKLLERIAPESFDVLHYAAFTVLQRKMKFE